MCKWFERIFRFIAFLSLVLCIFPLSSMSQEFKLWENLGIYGGTIYDIAIDPGDPNRVFAGSFMGDGVFLTEDGGNNWQPIEASNGSFREDTFKNHTVYAVKIASGNPDIVWVAHDFWVEKSMDGGKTWTHISNSQMQSDCNNCGGEDDALRICRSLAIDPIDPNIVYVGTSGPDHSYLSGTIYKTGDGGSTWEKIGFSDSTMDKTGSGYPDEFDYMVMDMDIDPQDPNIIWAVTNSGGDEAENQCNGSLYRSGDGGGTWKKIFPLEPSSTTSGFFTVAVKPDDSNMVFTGSGSGLRKHYKVRNWISDLIKISENCIVRDIAFDPTNPDIIYTTWRSPRSQDSLPKFVTSTNGGKDWDPNTIELVDPNKNIFLSGFLTLAVHPSNGNIIFGGELNLGVFKSQDRGQTWEPINNGINAMIVNDIVIDPNDSTHILTGTRCGVYEKKQNKGWLHLTQEETSVVAFHPTNTQIFYAGVEGRLGKTTDGGKNWSYSTELDDGKNYVSCIAIDPVDPNILFISVAGNGIYGRIYKSTNQNLDGGDWFGNPVLSSNYNFNVVAIDPSDSKHIFAGDGGYYDTNVVLGNLYESRDSGDFGTWDPNRLTGVIVNTLLIDPEDPNIIYVGCTETMDQRTTFYRTTDGGDEWESSCKDMHRESSHMRSHDSDRYHDKYWYTGELGRTTSSSITDLVFHPEKKNIIYASTMANGIFVSKNQGNNWRLVGTLPYYIYAIEVGSLDAVGTGGALRSGFVKIAGYIKDDVSNEGICDAKLKTVYDIIVVSVTISSDPNGYFEFGSLPSSDTDTYCIFATHGDYKDKTSNIIFDESEIFIDHNISMQRKTIQEKINDANDIGDIITVKPGIYYENIDFKGKSIILMSDPNDPNGVYKTIIDGNQVDSVVTFKNGEGIDSIIRGITLRNGLSDNGGGIYCHSSSPIISNCIIQDNSAVNNGGGIYCHLSSPIISNCIIQDNSAKEYGGGIYGFNSIPMLINNTMLKNVMFESKEDEQPNQIHLKINSTIVSDGEIINCGSAEDVFMKKKDHNTGKWETYYRFFDKPCGCKIRFSVTNVF
ncbi:MAG: hypothetical protein ACMUIU_17825 [bacterium]